LAKAGALDTMGERNQIISNVDEILKFSTNIAKAKESSQINLFGLHEESTKHSLKLSNAKPADKKQCLAWEKELLGIYLSDHPLKTIQTILPKISTPINELAAKVGSFQRIGGIITTCKKIITKNNETMIFMRVEDLTGNLEAVVFPRAYEQIGDQCQNDKLVVIEGKIQNKDGDIKILADEIDEIITEPEELIKLEIKYHKNQSEKLQKKTKKETIPYRYYQPGNNSKSIHPAEPAKPKSPEKPPLILKLPSNNDKKLLLELKEILQQFPGDTPVVLQIPINSHHQEIKTRTKVNIDNNLIDKLTQIIDRKNIKNPSNLSS